MSDRELLELAAKAAGITALRDPQGVLRNCNGFQPAGNIYSAPEWNPLTDDGDALRLAVKLVMVLDFRHKSSWAGYSDSPDGSNGDYMGANEKHGQDPYAATRRAIVRAAAEIGKGMA